MVKTATKIPGVSKKTIAAPIGMTVAPKLLGLIKREIKRRDRKTDLTAAEMAFLVKVMSDENVSDPVMLASRIITERDYAPPANAEDAAPPTDKVDDGSTETTDEDPMAETKLIDAQHKGMPTIKGDHAALKKMEAADGDVYIRYGKLSKLERARHYCAYYAKALRTIMEVVDAKTGDVLATFDGTGIPVAVAKAATKAEKPADANGTGAPRQRATAGKYDVITAKAVTLALRKTGVLRSELNELNNGEALNWKGMLDNAGKKQKPAMIVSTDKSGASPRYMLVMSS